MDAHNPLISWVIPAHLPTNLLHVCLESCLRQIYSPQEIIVVANGPEATKIKEIIYNWFPAADNLLVLTAEIANLGYALNLGISKARGQYIFRLDSDDLACPHRACKQVEVFQKCPSIMIVASAFTIIDHDNAPIKTMALASISSKRFQSMLMRRNIICHPSCAFRKKAWAESGGYRLHGLAEDYYLWGRVQILYPNSIAYIDEPLIGFRSTGLEAGERRGYKRYLAILFAQIMLICENPRAIRLIGIAESSFKLIISLGFHFAILIRGQLRR